MEQCANCINRIECHKSGQMNSFSVFCFEHDRCSFEQDATRPAYSMEVVKQLIYDCAADLRSRTIKADKEDISDRLMDILKEMDKM